MLLKPKYGRFRNDSVTSSDDLMQSIAMGSKVVATPVVPSGSPSLPLPPLQPLGRNPGPPAAPALADSPGVDGDQDGTTTFCMLIPKMPQWKFSNSLLSRSPSGSSSNKGPPQGSAGAGGASLSGPVASLAAVLNSCDPVCVAPCSLQAGARQQAAASSSSPAAPRASGADALEGSAGTGMNRRGRVEGIRVAGEDFTQKGSFIHKPSQGWLHPDRKITGPGASYIVRVSPSNRSGTRAFTFLVL